MTHEDVLKLLFPLELGGAFDGLMTALGENLDDAQASADTLLSEMFPDQADALLADWERITGVKPDPGDSLQVRRDRVVAQLRARGQLSRQYFIDIAATLGYSITIECLEPAVCGQAVCGVALLAVAEIRYLWRVTATGTESAYLEALFNRLKPAWTGIEFVYV